MNQQNDIFVSINNGVVGIVAATVSNESVVFVNSRRVSAAPLTRITLHWASGKTKTFTTTDAEEIEAWLEHDTANSRITRVEISRVEEESTTGHNVKGDEELRGEDPHAIDWTERQARSAVPFEVVDGLPINPRPRPDLKPGKGDLWHWGEGVCSDAIVFNLNPFTEERHLLLIKRGDGHGWALPGGGLDEGETAEGGCSRELEEETGFRLHPGVFDMLPARVVDDPRAGENAWMVTIPGIVTLINSPLPAVSGQDDADEAAWLPAGSWDELQAAIAERGGVVFPAHVDLLQEALSLLDQH
ncbi:NUDIX domain-containing protein [Nocardioides albus]|uniref:ADP-ribose pyrophosphatase YjhB (NUDIX family) n=1 Tax=Nocardioides albus TaxID=1841 RepID=A0A7W5FAR9_9ACTN|nr:NUDIX domain-containing protein [Nocardioides albus]MBB3091583.1 ADP-ribose pyrophosphatase YjhB (NUDIX family) [Nocardioides albus]GGU40797.1 hypothetical protein GCM10007979_44920 [Nocardioides albus]